MNSISTISPNRLKLTSVATHARRWGLISEEQYASFIESNLSLEELPTLTKSSFKNNIYYQNKLLSRSPFLLKASTSGSSGEPFTLIQHISSQVPKSLVFKRWLSSVITPQGKLALVWRNKKPSVSQRINVLRNRLFLFPIYDLSSQDASLLSEERAERLLSSLLDAHVTSLRSYVSILEWLSHLYGRKLRKLNLFSTIASAECLPTDAWNLIEDSFGCPCINLYGGTEASPIASSTLTSRRLYLFENLFQVRTSQVASFDSQSDILVTDLNNTAMPLINFEIGDLTSGIKVDSAGRAYLKDVIGRKSEIIDNLQGHKVSGHFIHVLLRKLQSILRYRVYSIAPGKLRIVLQPLSDSILDPNTIKELEKQFQHLGFDANIVLGDVEYLANYKHLTFVKQY
jgi:phenylacetate-coenzyme A ligase PaaK-like adenylate-forming protein